MEFVDGKSLHHIIHNEENLPAHVILKYSQQIISAIQTLHSKKIYHMDLKPNNIVLEKNSDQCKIIDFGSSILSIEDKKFHTMNQVNFNTNKI